jgi:hypothetical protein
MPCVVPEMLWSLDELKRALISEFPILETEVGEGFKILFDLFVEWAEILLNFDNQHLPKFNRADAGCCNLTGFQPIQQTSQTIF